MTMPSLGVLATLWFAISAAFILWRWKIGRGAGLAVSVVLGLSAVHWMAVILYLLPWYQNLDPALVYVGFRTAIQGLCAFCLGAALVSRRLKSASNAPFHLPSSVAPLGLTYLVVGLVMYGVLWPRFGRIASLGALIAAGSSYIVLGICLRCWKTSNARVLGWLAVGSTLPFLTILTQGYLSYGLAALAAVAAFVAEILKSRRKLVLTSLVLGYVTLSFYVTYMRDRSEIRDAVWNGAAAVRRIDVITSSIRAFEWFDPYNDDHLYRIDERLNQNFFVGVAVNRLNTGSVAFGRGETIKDALIAMMPRILFPEKEVVAGSADIVSRYTGIMFMEGTSVGVGLVMESFINFGTLGVWIGFAAFGALLVFVEERARQHLELGDGARFALWYLPGSSLVQVCGGSLVDGTSSAAAALVSVLVVNAIFASRARRRTRLRWVEVSGPAPSEPAL